MINICIPLLLGAATTEILLELQRIDLVVITYVPFAF
jgi:hypothetical protein